MPAHRRYGLPVRRSHLVGPYGPGSIVSFQNGTTCIVAELDQWFGTNGAAEDYEDCVVENDQLAAELGVSELRTPPPAADRAGSGRTVPVYRFPLWERCPAPGCSQAWRAQRGLDQTARVPCDATVHRERKPLRIQLDLVVCCPAGHVDDVPWPEVAHPGSDPCGRSRSGASLAITASVSADGFYNVKCRDCGTEGLVRRDSDLEDVLCYGRRMWQKDPESGRSPCEGRLRVLDRHATTVYFPKVVSRLAVATAVGADPASAEYNALLTPHDQADLIVRPTTGGALPFWMGTLSQVERVRETRALAGFQRVTTASHISQPDLLRESVWAGRHPLWALALDGYGEGFFVSMAANHLAAWESDAVSAGLGSTGEPRVRLVHSLAHIVLADVASRCGYPTASLRERLYTSPGEEGFLVYTTAGDEAGTLGGLARLGTPAAFGPLLERGVAKAKWCSADPLCSDRLLMSGGVACHQCLYLPETCCQLGNSELDRRLLQHFFQWTPRKALPDAGAVVPAAPQQPAVRRWDSTSDVQFDEQTFYPALFDELKRCTRSVRIWSPFTGARVDDFLPVFRRLVRRGVQVEVTVRPESGPNWQRHHAALQAAGVRLNVAHRMHQKVVIVDDEVVFEGSLNVLSATGTTGEVMVRRVGSHGASELRAALPRTAPAD